MKGYFLKQGKYKNGLKVEKIGSDEVKKKVVYDIADKDAQAFYDAGLFAIEGKKAPEVKAEPIAKAKVEPKKQEPKKDVKKK